MKTFDVKDVAIEFCGQRIDPSTYVSQPIEPVSYDIEPMTLDSYAETVLTWARYPDIGKNPFYPALGLCGEAGEVAEHVKKMYRDDGGNMTAERLPKFQKELGDVLWYSAALSREVGYNLSQVRNTNDFNQLARPVGWGRH